MTAYRGIHAISYGRSVSEASESCVRSAASSAAMPQHPKVDDEAQRSELLGSQGKRAARPQTEAESALVALFAGKQAPGKPAQDESASQEPDAATGTGMHNKVFKKKLHQLHVAFEPLLVMATVAAEHTVVLAFNQAPAR